MFTTHYGKCNFRDRGNRKKGSEWNKNLDPEE